MDHSFPGIDGDSVNRYGFRPILCVLRLLLIDATVTGSITAWQLSRASNSIFSFNKAWITAYFTSAFVCVYFIAPCPLVLMLMQSQRFLCKLRVLHPSSNEEYCAESLYRIGLIAYKVWFNNKNLSRAGISSTSTMVSQFRASNCDVPDCLQKIVQIIIQSAALNRYVGVVRSNEVGLTFGSQHIEPSVFGSLCRRVQCPICRGGHGKPTYHPNV